MIAVRRAGPGDGPQRDAMQHDGDFVRVRPICADEAVKQAGPTHPHRPVCLVRRTGKGPFHPRRAPAPRR